MNKQSIVSMIRRAREQKDIQKQNEPATDPIKKWMLDNLDELDIDQWGRPSLYDGESGVAAWLETKHSTTWDIRTAPDELVIMWNKLGILTVNTKLADELRKSAPHTALDILQDTKYRGEGESYALRIERVRE